MHVSGGDTHGGWGCRVREKRRKGVGFRLHRDETQTATPPTCRYLVTLTFLILQTKVYMKKKNEVVSITGGKIYTYICVYHIIRVVG